MATLDVLPYFHPTTVIFVDDDLDFLSNLSLQLDAHLAYRLFDSPNKALDYLNSATQSRSLSKRFFTTIQDNLAGIPTEPILRLDLAAIQREVRNTQRFAETALVMVDYAMPQMNGFEFCSRLNNPNVKKVLFTGVADEQIAVQAFNDGTIDRFIRKNERDVYAAVNATIRELQRTYIRDTAHTISQVLSLRDHTHLADPVFASFFNHLCRQYDFVEYYMSTEPGGFLLLDANGHTARLVVLTHDDLSLHSDLARSHGAPKALLEALTTGDQVPYFDTTPDGFFRPYCANWHECLHTAQILEGHQQYHCALIANTETADRDVVASYNGYLDWLDRTSYTLM